MLNQFSRTELLLGHDNMEKLKNARVAVFGIGGVGGFTVEALARSGVGTLDLIDDDKVCLTNINRQIIATRKTIGQYKVDAAKERVLDINPDAVVNTYKTFFVPDTADEFDFAHTNSRRTRKACGGSAYPMENQGAAFPAAIGRSQRPFGMRCGAGLGARPTPAEGSRPFT